jgi:acetyl coenzyme A synthetase (ADP forming)-like protein
MALLKDMLNARAVALVGASEGKGAVGRALLENLLRSKDRKVYPVNPAAKKILELDAWPSITGIPDHVDLAIVATPAPTVPGIVEECGKAGVGGVVIISAGFKEAGVEGQKLENAIEDIRKKYGMRILGPNCLGFARPGIGLNATFLKGDPPPGDIAFLSQSGALGAAIVDWATNAGVGFSLVASLGSMIDVDFGDMIDFLGDDYPTRSILIYMEGVGNARKFISAARSFARHKPIIALKPGRFTESAKAAQSHTGAMAGDDAVYDAAFRRAGVVRVREIADLFDAAEVLHSKALPRGPRLAVVTDAGGPGVMATDALIDHGGELARLSEESIEEMNGFLPPYWSKANPVDILGDADVETYVKSIDACFRDPGVDGVLVIYVPQESAPSDDVAREVVRLSGGTWKPVTTSWMGGKEVEKARRIFLENNLSTYETPEEAVRTYLTMYRYRRNLDALYETPAELPVREPSDKQELKAAIREMRTAGESVLNEGDSRKLLASYGIPSTVRQITADYELILGARKNKDFGSVILFGMGGTAAELFNDFSIGLPPLNQTLAKMLMQETKVYKMLQGFRGKAPADFRELEEILVSFSNLIVDFPEIAEIDINPLAIADGRAYALDARIVIDMDYIEGGPLYPHLVVAPYPTRYVASWKLPDGVEVLLRPIKPEDEGLMHDLAASVSDETIKTRFFSPIRPMSHEWLILFCNIDYDRHMAIVAEITEGGNRKIIGVGRVIMYPDLRSGELALLVHDRYQRQGLGYELMQVIIGIGRDKGLAEVAGDVLADNEKMLKLARKLGFTVRLAPGGIFRITLKLKENDK